MGFLESLIEQVSTVILAITNTSSRHLQRARCGRMALGS